MAEHRSYLASVGALTALVCCADFLRTHWVARRGLRYLIPAGVVVWILTLCVTTVARNHVWSSEISIWRDAAQKSPNKFRPWINLGVVLFNNGDRQEAVLCARQAIRAKPNSVIGYINLALSEKALGHYPETVAAAQAGLMLAPYNSQLHLALGEAYYKLKQVDRSIFHFRQATAIRPADPQPHFALGVIYSNLHKYDSALNHFKTAAALQPDNFQYGQAVFHCENLLLHQKTSQAPAGNHAVAPSPRT